MTRTDASPQQIAPPRDYGGGDTWAEDGPYYVPEDLRQHYATAEPPKTPASVRTIPLPKIVVDTLAAHLAAYPVDDNHGLVFTLDDGRPITRQAFGHLWRPVAGQVGVPVGTGLHLLRHYYASLLIRHGESVKTVQARLGHASATETLDTYAHLWPDSEDRTREAIDSVLGASPDGRSGGQKF